MAVEHALDPAKQGPLCGTPVGDVWNWVNDTNEVTCRKCQRMLPDDEDE